MPRLLVEDALGRTSTFQLNANEVVIGRAADVDLVLEDRHASRRHASITRESGVCIIKDLNSGNGVYVNGERVSQKVLAAGDVVKIGHCRLVFSETAGSSEVRFSEHDTEPGAVVVRRVEEAASPGLASIAGQTGRTAAEKELELLQKKGRILTLMYEFGKSLKGAVAVDQVYCAITELLLDVCAAERVLVLEIDESSSACGWLTRQRVAPIAVIVVSVAR